ncbi:MAG: hypothetical protein ACK5MV_08620 [Aminipila sp.]
MRFLVVDIKRVFTERNFIAAVIVGIISVFLPFLYSLSKGINDGYELYTISHSLILPFIAPLLACFSYSNMSMIEKDSRFNRLMLVKNQMKNWEIKRFLVNGIAGGSTLTIPLLILMVICLPWGISNNIIDVIFVVMMDFVFGFAFASIAYGLTFFNNKQYIPMIAPQVMYLLMIYAFPHLQLEEIYPPIAFSPWILPGMFKIENMAFIIMSLLVLSVFIVLMGKVLRITEDRVNRRTVL